MKKTWLLYCRYALTGLVIYRTTTEDLYNVIGYLHSTSLEHIDSIWYNEETPARVEFWRNEGKSIHDLRGYYPHD